MARITTTTAISQPLAPLRDCTTVVRSTRGSGLSGSCGLFWFAMKVSSVDEKYQSTAINAQSTNGFHARDRKRRQQDNLDLESLPVMHFPHEFGSDRAETAFSTS